MRRGLAAGTAALLACACAPDDRVVEVPPGLARIAIAHRASEGWTTSSGLLPTGADEAHRAALAADGSALVLGWTDAALADTLGPLPDDAVLTTDALREPQPCEAVLPSPAWAMRVDASGAQAIDAAALPPLTAAWASTRCPDVEMSTQVSCGDEIASVCPVRQVVREGCAYRLDFECELGRVVVGLDGTRACTTTRGCTAQRSGEGQIVLSCDATCPVDNPTCQPSEGGRAVACSATIEPAPRSDFDEARVRLTLEPPRSAATYAGGEVWPGTVFSGYLGTPLVLPDRDGTSGGERLVVPVHGWRADRRCRESGATRLALVSTASAGPPRWVEAPDCLDLLAHDPIDRAMGGGAFLGAHGEDPPAISRFDARGAATLTATLALPPVGRRVDLLSADDGALVLIYETTTHRQAVVAVLDPLTLRPRHHRVFDDLEVSAAVLTDDRWLVVADDFSDVIVWFDLGLTTCLGSVSGHVLLYPLLDLGNVPVLSMLFVQPTRKLLVAVNEYPALHVYEDLCLAPVGPGESCLEEKGRCAGGLRALPLDRGAEPVRTVPWGARFAVASTVRDTPRGEAFQAVLTLFDPRVDRFVPGVVPLGHGIPRDAVVDGAGALWVTLPWAGEVVRLSEPRGGP